MRLHTNNLLTTYQFNLKNLNTQLMFYVGFYVVQIFKITVSY